mgnify:FL=1
MSKCPKCGGRDVEIVDELWVCWDCDWEEELNKKEKKDALNNE